MVLEQFCLENVGFGLIFLPVKVSTIIPNSKYEHANSYDSSVSGKEGMCVETHLGRGTVSSTKQLHLHCIYDSGIKVHNN